MDEITKPMDRETFFKELNKTFNETLNARVTAELEAKNQALKIHCEARPILESYSDSISFAEIGDNNQKNMVVSLVFTIKDRVKSKLKVSKGTVFIDKEEVLTPENWDKEKFESIVQEMALTVAKMA